MSMPTRFTVESDAQLLVAWGRMKDAHALAAMCDRHTSLVHATCRRLRSPDADEATQAVFIILAKRPEAVDRLAAWLVGTARRVVAHQLRAQARRRRHEQEAAMRQVMSTDGQTTGWDEAREHLDAALASLSAGRREAVVLFYLEGKPQSQVATELGCSAAAVKTRVNEGLELLRGFLKRRGIVLGAVALASGLASEAAASEPALIDSCAHAAFTPSSAPGAMALAQGVITAMLIRTGKLVAAGLLLVGICLTAVHLVSSATSPPPMITTAQSAPARVVSAVPVVARPPWASDSGKDQYGTWADLQVTGVTQRFRWIQPGTFSMGSPVEEKGRYTDAETPHRVTLTTGFWMADSTCTQALWQAIVGVNPAMFRQSPQQPVEQVSWDDCQRFLSTLNGRISHAGFRLPSEAEWEYACRAGTTTAYNCGTTITQDQANVGHETQEMIPSDAKPIGRTRPVNSYPPNAWGLFDMHGNIWQWCHDRYAPYPGKAELDPLGPASGGERVFRGSCFDDDPSACRSGCRRKYPPHLAVECLGFRLVAQAASDPRQVQPMKPF